ncbi:MULTISPECIES: endonuclease/exonuclease/phosphatase family protein [Emticicia]|uniref:endonuclease/exonuclease/phosphatase family protein n=1 Tax=Emticicia TaxID=312278 RepID=UPI00209FC13F|nr:MULTISPECIES: endonuclease/exonuclease/phosphatase family protein [Emticicia]UTA69869.1 endonuclease/exonuclease/phosphatase family protein [Emticicia sp. 21SJ11W-3]
MTEFLRLSLKRILFLLNMITALYTLLVYQLSYSVSVKHWLGGFMTLSLPIAWFFNIFFILIWALRRSKRALISVIVLAIGFPLILRTFVWHQPVEADKRKTLSVLTYNLMWSDTERFDPSSGKSGAVNIMNTALDIDADIKCVQELYNLDSRWQFALIKRFREKNKHYTYVHSTPGNDQGQGAIGLAIFSRYPIIKKKEKHWAINHNGLLAADIVVGRDTIRVMNVQLRSMGVRVTKVLEAGEDKERAKKEAKTIYHQLRDGFKDRIIQMIELERWIKASPYPVIIAGDFNEVPYGYAYGRTRKYLNNAFEARGRGFGFTYHYPPGFLRIDNQFFDENYFETVNFRTYSDKPYSDHYPVWAQYAFKR